MTVDPLIPGSLWFALLVAGAGFMFFYALRRPAMLGVFRWALIIALMSASLLKQVSFADSAESHACVTSVALPGGKAAFDNSRRFLCQHADQRRRRRSNPLSRGG